MRPLYGLRIPLPRPKTLDESLASLSADHSSRLRSIYIVLFDRGQYKPSAGHLKAPETPECIKHKDRKGLRPFNSGPRSFGISCLTSPEPF